MKPPTSILSIAAIVLAGTIASSHAQNATTDPVGFVTVDIPQNSDTLLSAPLTQPPVYSGSVSTRSGFTVSVSPSPSWSTFSGPHYLQVGDGSQAGMIFDIANNTSDTLTIVDNGIEPTGLASGTTFKIVPYWTLGMLFPASSANASYTPSTSTSGSGRRTQILFPNIVGTGANRAPSSIYFSFNGTWRNTASPSLSANDTPILPDSYFIVRNPSTAADGLKLTVAGAVSVTPIAVPLDSAATTNDNYVSISRPLDITLDNLGLVNTGNLTASPFTASVGTSGGTRRDQLMVFNNSATGFNKSPSAIYYYLSTNSTSGWRSTSNSTADAGNTILPAGSAVLIRKSAGVAPTKFWKNEISLAQ